MTNPDILLYMISMQAGSSVCVRKTAQKEKKRSKKKNFLSLCEALVKYWYCSAHNVSHWGFRTSCFSHVSIACVSLKYPNTHTVFLCSHLVTVMLKGHFWCMIIGSKMIFLNRVKIETGWSWLWWPLFNFIFSMPTAIQLPIYFVPTLGEVFRLKACHRSEHQCRY